MTKYVHNGQGPIRSVDTTVTPDAVQACLTLRDAAAVAPIEAQLKRLNRIILSQTQVDGHPVLVTTGPRDEAEFIDRLGAQNGGLAVHIEQKPFDAWKVRSLLGFGGQTLQLISSVMKKKIDAPLLVFSTSNLTANGINLVYRAQKWDDPYQLRALKQGINERLEPRMPAGDVPPDVSDARSLLREYARPKPVDAVDAFMRKNSVNVGELGLRFIGAFGMALPASDWKKAIAERRLPMTDRKAPLRSVAGFGSIAGKLIALASTVPDPYNPKPRSWLDRMREKYSFLTGGLVEAGAFSVLTYDALANSAPVMKNGVLDTSRSVKFRGKFYRDWLSGIGGAMFVAGYIVRSWANFGERQVNMPELYAHASDTIAMLPRERIPQAVADISAYLTDHFKRADLPFNTVYNKLSDDLARSHHITMDGPTANVPVGHVDQAPGTIVLATGLEHQQNTHQSIKTEPASWQELEAARIPAAHPMVG